MTPYVFIGLLAFGLTFVVVAGEIDISVVLDHGRRCGLVRRDLAAPA